MIGSSKNKRENYPRKCFWTQEKETKVKVNPGLSTNRPSNNWAQVEKKSKCTPGNLLSQLVAQNKDFGAALQMLLLGFDNICDAG